MFNATLIVSVRGGMRLLGAPYQRIHSHITSLRRRHVLRRRGLFAFPEGAVGRELTKWAAQQNDLPKRDYQVLLAMGMVAHDDHGQFFANPAWFMKEYYSVHGISNHSTLKNHYASLVRRGCIGRIRKGNGRNPKRKGSATLYQLLAYGWLPAKAFVKFEEAIRKRGNPSPPRAQGKLPILTIEAPASQSRQDLQAPQEVLPRQDLQAPQEVLPRQDLQAPQEVLPRQDLQAPQEVLPKTGPPKIHDDHVINDKDAATTKVAAASPQSSFFDELASACAERGVRGIRPALFEGLRAALSRCPVQLTDAHADWCADEIMYANRRGRIRNPAGYLIRIVERVLKDGQIGVYIDDPGPGRLRADTHTDTQDDMTRKRMEAHKKTADESIRAWRGRAAEGGL